MTAHRSYLRTLVVTAGVVVAVGLFVPAAFEPMLTEARLEDLPGLAAQLLEGKIAGRVVVNPRDPPT